MPSSPVEATESAREGAREGTAVGTSSVVDTWAVRVLAGPEKTGPDGGMVSGGGRGAAARPVAALRRTVLSAKASISSADDWVGKRGVGAAVMNGSGEARAECAVAREPGPEDGEDEPDPSFDDLVERAPPRKRLARTMVGESPGNQGLRQEQQKGVTHVAHAKCEQWVQRRRSRAGAVWALLHSQQRTPREQVKQD